jgi:hypothetical protein
VDDLTRYILALGGDMVVRASGTTVEVLHVTPTGVREVTRFDLDARVNWLDVAPDGLSALIWGGWTTRLWRWRNGEGHQLIASRDVRGGDFGGGFLTIGGETITLIAQRGVLRGVALDGRERFSAQLGSPRDFLVRGVVRLPGDRLALFGDEGDEPFNQIVTVSVDELLNDFNSIQEALRLTRPVRDRAIRLAVGPCTPDSAVVFRDPENEEVSDDHEDLEDLRDVGNFRGVYIRGLDEGTLLERIPYRGPARSGVRIAATPRLVVLEAVGGIDIIDRGSGEVREIRQPAMALDVSSMRVAQLGEDGNIQIIPVTVLL